MDNIKLLELSIKYPENQLDRNYMFVEKHKDLKLYVKRTKEIKKTLIAINKINRNKNAKSVLNDLYLDLQQSLKNYANSSEFACFINACDTEIDALAKDIDLLKDITELYFKKRDLNEVTPEEWIQAVIDKGSSRKKGTVGEDKLINILVKSNYKKVDDIINLDKHSKAVAKFPKNSKVNKLFKTTFGKKTQNKKLDLIIKKGKNVYFLEAKHLKTSGGSQDKQVYELINILRDKPKKNNYFHVSFLDGVYFNFIFNNNSKKTKDRNKYMSQRKDIYKYLKQNKNNYFINTAGFKELF
ncbi:MAG: hypothetical protein ABIG10_03765 [bacterium]